MTDAQRPNTTSWTVEFYAVIYRRDQARLCDGWTGFQHYAEGGGSAGSRGPDHVVREPAYTCYSKPILAASLLLQSTNDVSGASRVPHFTLNADSERSPVLDFTIADNGQERY